MNRGAELRLRVVSGALEARGGFRETFEDSPEFYVTSGSTAREEEARSLTRRRMFESYGVVAILLAVVGLSASGLVDIAVAALLGAVLTPFGYQTNLMVYSAGDYCFWDFARVGAPLQLVFIGLVILIVPMIWPF